MKLIYYSFFATALCLLACNNKLKVRTNSFDLDEPFQLRILETAKLNNSTLQVTFSGLPEDSRCPEDANCIWEGQVRLFVDAAVPEKKANIEFKIEKSKMGKVSQPFGNYTIQILDLQPLTKSGVRIAQGDYVATFKVSNL